MREAPTNTVVILQRTGVAYEMEDEGLQPMPRLLIKALADVFPEGVSPRFRQHGIAFALPEGWRAEEPIQLSDGRSRAFTQVLARVIAVQCNSVPRVTERRYGEGAGTEAIMSALNTMATDSALDAIVLAVDGPSPSVGRASTVPTASVLLFSHTGPPDDEIRVLGVQQVEHATTPSLSDALSLAIGGALEQSGSLMVDVEHVVIAASPSLTSESVNAATQTLSAPARWGGHIHTQDEAAGPFGAATGIFDLAFATLLLVFHRQHGQRCLWVSRTDTTTCAVVLRQDGGGDAK